MAKKLGLAAALETSAKDSSQQSTLDDAFYIATVNAFDQKQKNEIIQAAKNGGDGDAFLRANQGA